MDLKSKKKFGHYYLTVGNSLLLRWDSAKSPINTSAREEIKHLPSEITYTLFGSVILTVSALIASWPASTFFLMYYTNPQDTGALIVGSGFAVLACCVVGCSDSGLVKNL